MFAEGVYLLVYSNASYRKNINRRLKVMSDKTDRKSVLVQLRRERGLTSGGDYRLPIVNLNQLLLQSGLSIGFGRLILVIVAGMVAIFAVARIARHAWRWSRFAGAGTVVLAQPPTKKFSAQFPDGIDIIVRSLRAGHPVPIAIAMVAREMADPIGTEFGIVTDEMTYGSGRRAATWAKFLKNALRCAARFARLLPKAALPR